MDYIELDAIARKIRRLPSKWENGKIFIDSQDVLDAIFHAPRKTIEDDVLDDGAEICRNDS